MSETDIGFLVCLAFTLAGMFVGFWIGRVWKK